MEQDKIWDAYQNDPDLEEMGCRSGGRIEYVARKIPVNAAALNIGAGQGKLEKMLSDGHVNVFSLDPSESSINRIRDCLGIGEDQAKVGYSQNIPFPDDTFDYVIMTEVLEHLDDEVLMATLPEVRRVLKPGGKFVGTVPADEKLNVSMVVCPDCGKKFHRWGHVQSFSEGRLKKLLSLTFSSVDVKRKFFLHYPDLNWKGKVAATLKWTQAALKRKGRNQNFYFEAHV